MRSNEPRYNNNGMLTALLSDVDRRKKIYAALILIVCLLAFGIYRGPQSEVTFHEINRNTREYLGQYITFHATIVDRSFEGTQLLDRGMIFYADGIDTKTPIGTTLTGIGRVKQLNGEPAIGVTEYTTLNYITIRDRTTLVLLAFILGIFAYFYRWNPATKTLSEKNKIKLDTMKIGQYQLDFPFVVLLLGVVLPLILSTPFLLGSPNSYVASWIGYVVRTPIIVLLVAFIISLLFTKEKRITTFFVLMSGASLYWLFEFIQLDYIGRNYLLFPFSFVSIHQPVVWSNVLMNTLFGAGR